jgi:large subunit ribosomal protein L4
MASVRVYNKDGSEAAQTQVNDTVFAVPQNITLIHQVVVALQNAKRQGNAETKVRKEVRGGGAKPFRQKGTGRARQGSSREPHMRGGGVVFGPHKRSYCQQVPSKMRRKALRCALSERLREEQLCLLSDFSMDVPHTAPLAEMVAAVSPEGRKTLLVTAANEPNVTKSAANLERVTVRTASDVNALDIVAAKRIVLMQDALATLEDRLS